MKKIADYLLTFVIFIVIIFTVIILIGTQMKITNARNFHSQCINRIQSSYYAENVIAECKTKAQEYGYQLEVQDQTIYDDRKDVKVELTYRIEIALFDVGSSSTLVGYAR